MKSFILIGAVCLQLSWTQARGGYSNGVGAFSYQDSSGNRYGGTYGLKDGEVVDAKGNFPPDFSPPTDFATPPDFLSHPDFSPPNFDHDDFSGFFSGYFRNLENLLQDTGFAYYPIPPIPYIPTIPTNSYMPAYNIPNYGADYNNRMPNYGGSVPSYIPDYSYNNPHMNRAFEANLDNQKIALDAAHKAFDLTSNQAGNSPNLTPSRFPFSGPGNAGFPSGFPFDGGLQMPDFGKGAPNSAYASASVGPGYQEQVAAINPANPNSPNVYKSGAGSGNPGGYKSVSVSSYSSTSDMNGRKTTVQGADTMVNDNGKLSRYHVQSP